MEGRGSLDLLVSEQRRKPMMPPNISTAPSSTLAGSLVRSVYN